MSQIVFKITRPFARLALKIYFKRIHFSNVEHIPFDKPVILASNHPTAFIEPIILASFLPKPLSYLVRGDVFINSFIKRLLEAYNMIPIFRFVDGFNNLRKNASSFEHCYQALKDNKTIMIMVEGVTHQDKKLWPLQKGAARIVFDATEKYGTDLDIQIVPMGVNFTDDTKFRSEVMIDFGKPISVNEYWKLYQTHDRKAIRKLTTDLFSLMKQHIIEIDDPSDTELIENALLLYRNNQKIGAKFQFITSNQRLLDEKRIASFITEMNLDEKRELKVKINDYFRHLNKLGINDIGVATPQYFKVINSIKLLVFLFPALIGWLLNIIPFMIGHFVSKKSMEYIEFFSPVRLLLVFIQYVLLIFALFFFVLFTKTWFILSFLFILPISGIFFIHFTDLFYKWNSARKFQQISTIISTKLLAERKEIIAVIGMI